MKKWCLVLLAILVVFCFSSCSKSEEKQTTSNVTVTADGKKELVFWTRMNDKFEEEIAAFETAHPDVKVKRVGIGSDYDDLQTKYIASAVSGELPHVGLVSQRYGIPQLYDAGVVVPVEELMTQEEKEDVFQAYWDKYTYKGVRVAIPFQVSMPMLYINLDMLEEKGLSIPTTWEEMMDTALKLTEDTNDDGITDIYGINMPADAPWYLNGFFKAAGADVIQGDQVNINQPEVVAILESIAEMVANGSMPSNQHSTAKDDFKNGSLAMLLNSCAGNGSIEKGVAGRFRYALVPLPAINGRVEAPLGGNGLAVFKSNPEMEALAWEFVQYMTSTEAYSGFSMEKGYIPIKESAFDSDAVKTRMEDPFWVDTFEQIDDLYGQPINPVDATIWNSLNDILSIIEDDPETSCAELVADMQKEIEDFLLDY